MNRFYWFLLSVILIGPSHLLAENIVKKDYSDFPSFLTKIKTQAIQSGVSTQTIATAFASISLNEKILALDKKQPEHFLSFGKYLTTRLSQTRIKNGKKYYKLHHNQLYQAQQKYGAPTSILVAFWGLETNFGYNTGRFNAIEALTSLSYHGRREVFFTNELIFALQLMDKQKIPNPATSSWAGAMGNMQFMPSNIKTYAKDINQNGLDLWQDLDDIFHSGAYFLKRIGWHRGQKWGREVILPSNFNHGQATLHNKQLLDYWRNLGVKTIAGSSLPKSRLLGSIILPAGHQGPAFLVYQNFHAILNWNRSIFYALSVGLLADKIAYNQDLYKVPKVTSSLSRNDIKSAQEKLIELDFLKDVADGIIGAKTRAALRKFQQLISVPADGYLNEEMLELLDF